MSGIPVKRATVIDLIAKTVTSKATRSATRARINASDLRDPVMLAKVLQQLQDAQDAMNAAQASNPHLAPCIVRRVSMTSGTAITIRHTLGVPYTDWWISRVWPSPSNAFTLPKEQVTSTPALTLILLPTSTNLVDITIAGG